MSLGIVTEWLNRSRWPCPRCGAMMTWATSKLDYDADKNIVTVHIKCPPRAHARNVRKALGGP